MKKILIPSLLIIYFGVILLLNYILPIINSFSAIDYDSHLFQYIVVIISYITIIGMLWIEDDKFSDFNIDRFSIVILIFFSIVRITNHIPHEIFFRVIILILGLVLTFMFIKRFSRIPRTDPRWTAIGFLCCGLVIPFAFLGSLDRSIIAGPVSSLPSFVTSMSIGAAKTLSFISPYEEIIFRAVLWGQLRRSKWPEQRIFWVLLVITWLLHFWEVFAMPITFLTLLPLTILVLGLLVYYSKQIFPSILFHTVCDTFVVIIVIYFLR